MTSHQEMIAELKEDVKNLKVMIANFEFDIAGLDVTPEPDITLVMADELEKQADSVMSFAQYPYKTLAKFGVITSRYDRK